MIVLSDVIAMSAQVRSARTGLDYEPLILKYTARTTPKLVPTAIIDEIEQDFREFERKHK